MIPRQWTPPCNNQCTHKYAALIQIPCLGECDEICYKDPVLKDQQWSAYIDRSPGAASYSEECFRACVAGCGYKFDLPSEIVNQVHSKRPSNPPTIQKPPNPPAVESRPPCESASADDIPSISA
ncbi:Hypothetical predicted protein [Olea europaea subsp. europaea]|uniref:Uncharacterized protein n=1 Tax=Olea europaea subsp. europaea TaxID=158383 RepID=A0A8S0UXY9_OLEEU|nr:Hypothetical predicted protein [Olea europaea subsp. europaea]